MNMLKGLLSQMWVKKAGAFLTFVSVVAMTTGLFAQSADVLEAPKEFSMAQSDWVRLAYWVLALLVLAIVIYIFDVSALSERLTGKTVIKWNKVNGWMGLVMILFGVVGVTYELIYHGKHIALGDSASAHGVTLDSMFNWTFGFTFVVFVITEVLLFYFMYRYSYREGEKAHYYYHNNKLEILWTSVPAVVLTFLVLRGFTTWSKITNEEAKDATEIEVFAYQFGWKARYAGVDEKFGEAHFTFISGKNELGLAVGDMVDSLAAELEADIAKLKLQKDSVAAYEKKAKANLDAYLAKFTPEYDAKKYKELHTAYEDLHSGAYLRQLKKDLHRKEVQLERVKKFRADKAIFNASANDDKITQEIVLVKNKPYLMKFRARDVIHSAYIPEFRVQMNCVPGMSTRFAFTPTKTTVEARAEKGNKEFDYYMFCNKICGGSHYNMKIKVTVVGSEAEYDAWLAEQKPVVAPLVAPEAPAEGVKDTTAAKKSAFKVSAKTNVLANR